MKWDDYLIYQDSPDEAWDDISQALQENSLCLMVDAGISAGLGLPEWHDLARFVCERVNVEANLVGDNQIPLNDLNAKTHSETLMRVTLMARRKLNDTPKFNDYIREALYGINFNQPRLNDATDTLRALAMMAAGSNRGRVSEIVSFNFDCLLEWYLMAHGFVIGSYANWPGQFVNSDIRIYHPHGYLPFDTAKFGIKSPIVAFDEETLNNIAIAKTVHWKHLYRYLFCTRKALSIGLSGRDPIINQMLQEIEILSKGDPQNEEPVGFWCQKKPEEMSNGEWAAWKESLNSRRIVLLEYADHDELAEKLMKVVQDAAGPLLQVI